MAKMGRPTTNPRNLGLHIRISLDEKQLINECMIISGLTKTDIIIKGVKLFREQLNN